MAAMAARTKKDDEPERPAEPAEEAGAGERRSRARAAREPDERGPLAALAAGLDEIVPGIEVLDRELVLEGGARADLAAVDPSGRLYLVLLANEDADKAALEALDALGAARNQLELFLRHLGDAEVSAERAPRVLLVSPSADARLAERLSVLSDAGVLVLGLRTVKSAAGERTYLVRLDPSTRAASASGGVPAFLRALPARLEPLVHALLERMQRLDEQLLVAGDASALVWRLEGEVLCRVERIGELLQASAAPRHEPLPLDSSAHLDALAERCMAHLVHALKAARTERPAPGPRPVPSPRDEPLLTDEEIQAFRE
jgi:hypothetical protein